NILCPIFGGIAATGAIARTATNFRYGARSPLAAAFHAVIALLVILIGANFISFIPMAALSALLMMIAIQMADVKHVAHILKVAPRSDVIILVVGATLTALY